MSLLTPTVTTPTTTPTPTPTPASTSASAPTPDKLMADPSFHALPEIERLKVLYKTDPEYRKLHPRERWKVARMISLAPTPPPTPSTAQTAYAQVKGNGIR